MSEKIYAKILADSIDKKGHRITSFELQFPRIVLSEFNTHRAVSRNSASSRAIPFKKMLQRVMEEPFIPKAWQKEHKGMQGTEYFTPEEALEGKFIEKYLKARDAAVKAAKTLAKGMSTTIGINPKTNKPIKKKFGVTKQVINRLLEPFMYHRIVATATDWENFFALRAHKDAEIHIQELAFKMLEAYNESTPKVLEIGEWHVPFDGLDDTKADKILDKETFGEGFRKQSHYLYALDELRVKISTARCARVSYNNFDGSDDYEADLKLHDRLLLSGHLSPFEHCAQCTEEESYSGNFYSWKQYRKTFNNENQKDERVIAK